MFGKKKEKDLDDQIAALQKEAKGNPQSDDIMASFNAQFGAAMDTNVDHNTAEGRANAKAAAANFDAMTASLGIKTNTATAAGATIQYDSESPEANELYERAKASKDENEIFGLLVRCDQLNHYLASAMLAKYYENGFGTAVNIPLAMSLYLKAGEKGMHPACKRLYEIYDGGLLGQPRDKEKAKYWKEKTEEHTYNPVKEARGLFGAFKKNR